MAFESEADRLHFFDTDDWATSAAFTSPVIAAVQGIFDDEEGDIDLTGDPSVIAPVPTFTCRTADISGVDEASALTVASANYLVKDRYDDATGTTVLELETA